MDGDRPNQCPECGDKLHAKAVSCACGWRLKKPVKSAVISYDSSCSWNDHGDRCGRQGVASPSTGGGDWYCREHYARLRGYTWPDALELALRDKTPATSYRERQFLESKKPYEPPFIGHVAGFQCVGTIQKAGK